MRDVEIPVKLPAALLGDALELKPPETLAALLAEWSCALDPGQLLRAARSSWFEDRSGFVWDVAAVAAVDRELIGELRTAADEETRAVAEAMLQTRAEEMLEPAPPAEAALPVLLGLAVLGTLLEGAGARHSSSVPRFGRARSGSAAPPRASAGRAVGAADVKVATEPSDQRSVAKPAASREIGLVLERFFALTTAEQLSVYRSIRELSGRQRQGLEARPGRPEGVARSMRCVLLPNI